MKKSRNSALTENLIERLANLEHERWAHWQKYMHSKCEKKVDGSLVIPSDLVAKWERQISTSYFDLSEREKESDREQVNKYLPIILDTLSKK